MLWRWAFTITRSALKHQQYIKLVPCALVVPTKLIQHLGRRNTQGILLRWTRKLSPSLWQGNTGYEPDVEAAQKPHCLTSKLRSNVSEHAGRGSVGAALVWSR